MNSLLRRQLKKGFGEASLIPPEWQTFIDAVNNAYNQFDSDRHLLERSLELSSAELVQASSQMTALFDAFPDLFFRLDAEGRILDHKCGSANRISRPANQIIGRRIQDVYSLQAGDQYQDAIRQLLERRKPLSIEYAGEVQGVPEQYEARLVPLPEDEMVVIIRNITERKRAEEALRTAHMDLEKKVEARTAELQATNRSLEREIAERKRAETALQQTETKFRTLVEQLPAITYMAQAGEGGEWSYVSPQITGVLGFSPEEWMASPELPVDQLHPDDRDRVLAEEARCLRSGTPFECEYRFISKQGRVVWCRDHAILLAGDETNQRFFQGVILDITERKHLEDQLLQSSKMEAIGRLAGGIAHDFNNILTAIIGDSYLVSVALGKDHPSASNVEGIIASANRATGLTRQLLAYSRRQMLQPKIIDLNTLIINLESMLRRLIGEHIELHTIPGEVAALVKADPGQIEQVIVNLVVNARDAMPNGGKLTIEAIIETVVNEITSTQPPETLPGVYAGVVVRDTGTGISEEVKAHLFEPFFTTKVQGKGTGLGLATCYGIVKQSGGYILVESNPDDGSSFKVLLPYEQEKQAQNGNLHRESDDIPRGTEAILVAEDENQVRTLVVAMLRRLGYTVYEAEDGKHALRVFDEIPMHRVDLLLTDVIMPQTGGRELAEKLLGFQPDLKVLFMSGYTADSIENCDLLALGGGFLQKPFTPAALARKVREELVSTAGA